MDSEIARASVYGLQKSVPALFCCLAGGGCRAWTRPNNLGRLLKAATGFPSAEQAVVKEKIVAKRRLSHHTRRERSGFAGERGQSVIGGALLSFFCILL